MRKGLVDVDETLLVFGGRRAVARRHYLVVLGKGRQEAWIDAEPGRLPWWRRAAGKHAELRPDRSRPAMDWLARISHRGSSRAAGDADDGGRTEDRRAESYLAVRRRL